MACGSGHPTIGLRDVSVWSQPAERFRDDLQTSLLRYGWLAVRSHSSRLLQLHLTGLQKSLPVVPAPAALRTKTGESGYNVPTDRQQEVSLKFGAHMPTSGGLHKAFGHGMHVGCDTIQIFSKNQQQ